MKIQNTQQNKYSQNFTSIFEVVSPNVIKNMFNENFGANATEKTKNLFMKSVNQQVKQIEAEVGDDLTRFFINIDDKVGATLTCKRIVQEYQPFYKKVTRKGFWLFKKELRKEKFHYVAEVPEIAIEQTWRLPMDSFTNQEKSIYKFAKHTHDFLDLRVMQKKSEIEQAKIVPNSLK